MANMNDINRLTPNDEKNTVDMRTLGIRREADESLQRKRAKMKKAGVPDKEIKRQFAKMSVNFEGTIR